MPVAEEPIAFGPFCMDLVSTRLLREGVPVDLRPRAFCALKTLIQNSGRYVDYEQMIHQAWGGTWVSRHTVAVTVGEAKKVLKEYGSWISYRPKLGYRLEVPKSGDLTRKGWHFWNRYTREGFEKALCCFEQAAAEDGSDFRASVGLSLSYLMLGAYGMRPPREMYGKFLEAHHRAVELGGLTPELRADRAHGWHVFERRFAEAEAELLRAREEEPTLATTYGHLAMLYATRGHLDQALEVLAQAYAADALWPALPATEVFVRLCRREFESAVECAKKAVDLHPYLPLGRLFYAVALEQTGQFEEALAQYRVACVMSPDLPWMRAHEGVCLAKSGCRVEASRILEELQQIRQTEYVDAYSIAPLMDALGNRDQAFEELERALEENSATLFVLDVDTRMDPLREDARFAPFRDRIFSHPALVQAV